MKSGDTMDGNTILSVAKAMELLQLLSESGKPQSLKELSDHTGYPKSTVFGLVTTMREYGVIRQASSGKYTLGFRLFEYGRQVERSWNILQVARPYMELLSQQTGVSAMLSIYEDGNVITLDQVEARDKLRIVSEIGARLPVYCTSQGKVFLADMTRSAAEGILKSQTLNQFTPHTITDINRLLQEIENCRVNSYAIENGEYKIGLRSISAPIYNMENKVGYAIGVIGMFRSVHSDDFYGAVDKVCSAASQISSALEFQKKEERK